MVHVSGTRLLCKYGQVVAFLDLADMREEQRDLRYIIESPVLHTNNMGQMVDHIDLTGWWLQQVCRCMMLDAWEELPNRLARVRVDADGKVHALCHVGQNKTKNSTPLWFEFATAIEQYRTLVWRQRAKSRALAEAAGEFRRP